MLGRSLVFPALILHVVAASAYAQNPAITSPASGAVFKAGPDYATDVLQDAWDFSNAEDISPNPDEIGGWVTNPAKAWTINGPGPAFISNGRFQGTTGIDSQFAMLYRGDAIGLNPGRTGMSHPIDTSRFSKFAMKAKYNDPSGSSNAGHLVVHWYHAPYAAANWINRAGGALFLTGIPGGASSQVYMLDLSTVGQQGSGAALLPACANVGGNGCTGTPATWQAEPTVSGFRIDPTTFSSPVLVEIDWVRLTASDDAPGAAMMDVTYQSCAGTPTISVRDAANDVTVVATGQSSGARFNYGTFPPGSYTLIVTCANGSHEQPFSINDPPHVTVIDPDEKGDPNTDYEFTASNGANRWDFEEPAATDLKNAANVSTTGGACAGLSCGIVPSDRPGAAPGSRMLRASSVGSTASELGDPALEFLGGTTNPVASSRQRYLTFSLRLNRPYDVAVGSVVRLLWGSRTYTDQSTTTHTQDMRVWPGFQSYTIDLAALSAENGGIETDCQAFSPPCPITPWPTRSIRFFRLDPHEFGDAPTLFDLDDVSLNAPDEVNLSGSGPASVFTIRWTLTDSDSAGATYTTRLYVDADRDPSVKTLIATLPATASLGSFQYDWTPPAGLPAGDYWVYVETTEARAGVTQIEGGYSTGPIVVYSVTATSPQVTVSSPAPGQKVPFPFTIEGCAFDQGNSAGINMDDLQVFATAGAGVTGVAQGTTYALGYGSGLGALEYGPLTPSTPVVCPSVANTASPFHNAGFRVRDVGLAQGPWTLRVLGRSTIDGKLTPIASDIAFTSSQLVLGPVNFQLTASGNTITVSFQAPSGGPPISGYVIDLAHNPAFSPAAANIVVPTAGSYSGPLSNGTWYVRVRTLSASGSPGDASETKSIALPTGGAPPLGQPGAPVLAGTQTSSNPIVLSWTAGAGGAPSSYTLIAGTSPGGSDLGTFPMGMATSISANAPPGLRVYARVIAQNASGSATSNEINFMIAPPSAPGQPTLNPGVVNAGTVMLTWSAGAGSSPTSYTILARFSPGGAVAMSVPVTGNSFTTAAPPGTYYVSVVANNGAGSSAESNQITLVVP
jgi:hypothetical protein